MSPPRGEIAFYRACRFVAVGASRLVFPGRVLGREHVPDGPFVLAPVHRSYLDWLIVARVTRRRLRYIVKGEVFKYRAVARLIGALGAFPVRRDTPDREAFNTALSVLSSGEPLVIFPEGTRREGPEVTDLREGAAYLALRAGVPIVPVGLAGVERAMPRGSKMIHPGRVTVAVGPALYPESSPTERVRRSAAHELSERLGRAITEATAAAVAGERRPLARQ